MQSSINGPWHRTSALLHRDIVGRVQHGRMGFGLGTNKTTREKTTPAECRQLVVEDVRHKEVTRITKAISQAKRDCRKRWEGTEWTGKTYGIPPVVEYRMSLADVQQTNNKGILGGHQARQSLAMAKKEEQHKVQQLSIVRDQKVAWGHVSELDQSTACY